jgi:4-aminobutyrate aminotransferase-like enzyme
LKTCLEHHLLLLICGSYQNVIRWIPPLIASKDHIDEAVGIFAGALEQHA